ncbi:hypothetical protein K439DRAFT_775686 [Ramaria rubella]|nr:hypothetical protein K439DRAFT_775686 [Ramaria rubella]
MPFKNCAPAVESRDYMPLSRGRSGPVSTAHPYPFGPPPPYYHYPYPYPPAPAQAPAPLQLHGSGSSQCNDIPSSDPFDDIEDPTQFPMVQSWLETLDNGPRGADGQYFAQYGANLIASGYLRVSQITDTMTVGGMNEICMGILPGTSTLLLSYAVADVKRIHRKLDKERRQGQNTQRNR